MNPLSNMTDLHKVILAAAGMVALAIYAGGEPRYQIVPAGGDQQGAYVLDRSSGDVRVCFATTCLDAELQTPSPPKAN